MYWKLIVASLVVTWAIVNLIPFRDTPFEEYIAAEVSAQQDEFDQLMERAHRKVEDGEQPSVFMAMKRIASEEGVDISRFFPHIPLEQSLVNVDRRNDILMAELLKRSQPKLQPGLDLRGGVAFVLRAPDLDEDVDPRQREDQLQKAIEIIRSRADGLGVAEPVIRPVGDSRIEVQLPGLTTRDNPDAADELSKPALLEFSMVHRELDPRTTPEDERPANYRVLTLERYNQEGEVEEIPHFVHRIPELTGESVTNAFASMGEMTGGYEVILEFNSEGARRFADLTRRIAEENERTGSIGQLAIVLDGELYSAPTVRQEIRGGRAQITGRFTQREAEELANVLNNPLDLPLVLEEMYEVGPTLAEDSIRQGINAALYGAVLVIAFMIAYYMFAGLVACVTLGLNLLIILGVLSSLGATLTLPGIAGIVLTMGIAVDANILVFERIREELKLGKKLSTALTSGYEKALSAIVDANITTLLTAGILIYFGSGPVKGFGVTLAIGVFTSMFGALVITRFFLELLVNSGFLKKLSMLSVLQDSKIDFLKYRKPAFAASWAIVFMGLAVVAYKGERIYGIDFVGGDELIIQFEERISTDEIERIVAQEGLGEVLPVYQSLIGEEGETLRLQTEHERGGEVFAALDGAFPEAGLTVIGENRIGAAVGAEIQRNAFIAIGVALIGILLYVALRFEMGYGVGAVAAVIHDLLMVIGIFVLSGRQLSAPMVAAILMVAGYSINDTIVAFDRMREELGLDPNSSLKDIINKSINRVLPRTIITSATTLLATSALYIFGGGVINDFSFTFIIGILTGTFSSIFIASPVFFWWHKGDRRHVEERKDVLPNYEWSSSTKAAR